MVKAVRPLKILQVISVQGRCKGWSISAIAPIDPVAAMVFDIFY